MSTVNPPFKVVYSVSDDLELVTQTLASIKSLKRFVPKDEIIVFYTPPRSKKNYEKLSKVSTVVNVPNITEPFVGRNGTKPRRFGEKVHLCEVDFPNIVFLDADTRVQRDLAPLLTGDFDFSARPDLHLHSADQFDNSVWLEMFKAIGKQALLIFNTGFMIFKNYSHTKLFSDWLRYINDEELPNPSRLGNMKDQYALALAVAGKNKFKPMTIEQHAFVWDGEENPYSYVVHGRRGPSRFFLRW